MVNPRLAFRYAKSLIDLSKEKDSLETVYADMITLQQLCKGNPDFVKLLQSPVISPDKKLKIVEAVTAGRISPISDLFIRLLISKEREASLPEIAGSFIQQYKKYNHIHTVKLTTAYPVSEEIKNAIIDQVKKTSDMQRIELETEVDENLIGGFIIQTGDKLVDASVAYDLRQISKQFENNDFVYKVR